MQISERIYQISGGMYQNIANVYAIRTDEGLILIDCGETEEDLALMQEIMKRWDLDHLKVTHVLLTHKHFGHIGVGVSVNIFKADGFFDRLQYALRCFVGAFVCVKPYGNGGQIRRVRFDFLYFFGNKSI